MIDVAVAGGGPAGSAVAALLARDHGVTVFEDHPRIGLPEQCAGLLTDRAIEASGVSPDIRDTSVDDASVISMVELGLGYSILSDLILQGRRDNILALPLEPFASRSLGIAVQPLKQASSLIAQLIECSREVVSGIHAAPGTINKEKRA